MRDVEHNGREKLTLLELVLQLNGDFRRRLQSIRVTPLQAAVLLFLQQHLGSKVTDAATALRVRQPTMAEVVKDLVRKRWVTNRRSVEDRRTVCLRLTRQREVLAQRIEAQDRR
jgi:DNA-binding MarR family transcriptional regulator